ncbi:hypothetical protein [Parabacteroides sp. PF5-9]|uniref:hypothetical protein n=1 Tax=Parabacteroides sp. PF5-9 TaxID=1742404 RepID=UPI002475E2A8|nr:hypothetical protein [Parabacteroides sp. PF5-9]MDH6358378.1 ABC-type multidrug transport system fused ATPase/permease subunit [Parabacteroides sp. PF5-9]
MKKFRFLIPVGFLLIVAVFSLITMLLWNWLMPALFGLITINFWQAAGLLILARILFGGFGRGKSKMMMSGMMHNHRNPIHEGWMKMSPEQRRAFIEKRRKFGFGHPFDKRHFDMDEQEEQKNENE